jgi:hypothetical protein
LEGSDGKPDQRISVGRFDGVAWQPLATLGNAGSAVGPSLRSFRNRLYMAWRGVEGDQSIWFSNSTDGKHWDDQQPITGIGSLFGPSLAVFHEQLYMMWRGIDDDQRIYWSRTLDGSNWAPQVPVDGAGTAYQPALATYQDRLIAVWRGIDGDQVCTTRRPMAMGRGILSSRYRIRARTRVWDLPYSAIV